MAIIVSKPPNQGNILTILNDIAKRSEIIKHFEQKKHFPLFAVLHVSN